MPGRGVRENGMEGARLRGHAESLPSRVGNAGAESRGGDAVVAIDVRESIQPVSWGTRSCISRTVSSNRRGRWGAFGRGRALYSSESGAGPDRCGAAGERLSLEQPVLFGEAWRAAGMAKAGGCLAGGGVLGRWRKRDEKLKPEMDRLVSDDGWTFAGVTCSLSP